MSREELSQYKICTERLHHAPFPYDHPIIQQALFLKGVLWDLGTTITVSFIRTDDMPEWYDIAQVKGSLSPTQTLDPIELDARNLSPEKAIEKIIMDRLQPVVQGVHFKFVPSGGMLRVRLYKLGGSSSLVGTQSNTVPPQEHTITFGWLDVATIIHEFCHALGMLHEHSNPNGNTIDWNPDAVYEWARETQGWDEQTAYDNIIKRYSVDETNGSVYDPKSIMLYFFDARLTKNHVGTKENHTLSPTDIQWLTSAYPASGPRKFPGLGSPPPNGPLTPNGPPSTDKSKKGTMMWVIVAIIVGLLLLFFVINALHTRY